MRVRGRHFAEPVQGKSSVHSIVTIPALDLRLLERSLSAVVFTNISKLQDTTSYFGEIEKR